MNQLQQFMEKITEYEVGQKVKVKGVRYPEGERSHSFEMGEEVEVIGERNDYTHYSNDDLYLCSNGKVEQYLWANEIGE